MTSWLLTDSFYEAFFCVMNPTCQSQAESARYLETHNLQDRSESISFLHNIRDKPLEYALYPKYLTVEMVHYFAFVFATIVTILLALMSLESIDTDNVFILVLLWSSVVFASRGLWLHQYLDSYPRLASRFHKDNLFKANHYTALSKTQSILWFGFNFVMLIIQCLVVCWHVVSVTRTFVEISADGDVTFPTAFMLVLWPVYQTWVTWLTLHVCLKSYLSFKYAIFFSDDDDEQNVDYKLNKMNVYNNSINNNDDNIGDINFITEEENYYIPPKV